MGGGEEGRGGKGERKGGEVRGREMEDAERGRGWDGMGTMSASYSVAKRKHPAVSHSRGH